MKTREEQIESLRTILGESRNRVCRYKLDGEESHTVIFDWESIDEWGREEFMETFFGDWEEGSLEEIIKNSTPDDDFVTPQWVKGDWVPFGLMNAQIDEEDPEEEEILVAADQFDGIFMVKLSELEGDHVPVYLLKVDGTVLNEDPEVIIEDIKSLNITLNV